MKEIEKLSVVVSCSGSRISWTSWFGPGVTDFNELTGTSMVIGAGNSRIFTNAYGFSAIPSYSDLKS